MVMRTSTVDGKKFLEIFERAGVTKQGINGRVTPSIAYQVAGLLLEYGPSSVYGNLDLSRFRGQVGKMKDLSDPEAFRRARQVMHVFEKYWDEAERQRNDGVINGKPKINREHQGSLFTQTELANLIDESRLHGIDRVVDSYTDWSPRNPTRRQMMNRKILENGACCLY